MNEGLQAQKEKEKKKKIAFEHFPTKIKHNTISYFAEREREREIEMWLFNRKGPSGFSASTTAEEVTEGIDGTGLTAIVTGHLFILAEKGNNNNKSKKKKKTGFCLKFSFFSALLRFL